MTFVEALETAKDTRDRDAYIARVKAAVVRELSVLDSSVEIHDTHYFNHSAIPDLVVSWPKERGERNIYLRHSYEAIAASPSDAIDKTLDPVVLSLDTRHVADVTPGIDRQLQASPRALVTDPEAIDVLLNDDRRGSPLAGLVRANFIRGGKGHIDRPRAASLVGLNPTQLEGASGGSLVADLIGTSFSEDAAARITRTAQLVAVAMGEFPEQELGEPSALIGGKLSLAELRHLLPWLLNQPRAIANDRFWAYVGGMMSFADLEKIRENLEGVDVSPLIRANARRWSAKRAYLGLSTPVEGDETYLLRSNHWSFSTGALGIDIGESRLLLADNGKLIHARGGSSSATWLDIKDSLKGLKLARVELHGIRRSVTINAEQSDDVSGDVDEVTESLDDDYFVGEVAVRFSAPGDEPGSRDVDVLFGKSLVSGSKGAALADLVHLATSVLKFRAPLTDDQRLALISGVGESQT
ncbi:hypothetical protein E3T28_15220 [Cryobacterium sinapicolor]|uniref:Uncharacterized protein n=1 Tax=Cryobacterium sinapicolor TaxID=1259236 RepID=A0ABY2ITU9_9MICO|nr:hypothetical protein [Cryobacterium sinapicolor]TFC94398.1 hypothetical protein E3T28_15220 [Cryobacterium sinapicolor]